MKKVNILPYITNTVTPFVGILVCNMGSHIFYEIDFSDNLNEIINSPISLKNNRITINAYLSKIIFKNEIFKSRELVFLERSLTQKTKEELVFIKGDYDQIILFIKDSHHSYRGFPWETFTEGIYNYVKNKNTGKPHALPF